MALKQGLSQDIINCFLNTDEFAEDIVYTPKGESAKSIRAIVNRKRLDPSSEDSGRVLAGQAEIFVANDTAHGISLVSKGQDKVSLPEVIWAPAIEWVVIDIIDHDDGMFHLLIQK
jgi:hypothetical protein